MSVTVVLLAVGVATFLAGLLREALGDLLKTELRASLPIFSYGLVRRAAHSLPKERLGELEAWESELHEHSERPLAMFATAIQIWRHRKQIARESPAMAAAVPASRVTHRAALAVLAMARRLVARGTGIYAKHPLHGLRARLDVNTVVFSLLAVAYFALDWLVAPYVYATLGITSMMPSAAVRITESVVLIVIVTRRARRLQTGIGGIHDA
jgi:hypothetical protein